MRPPSWSPGTDLRRRRKKRRRNSTGDISLYTTDEIAVQTEALLARRLAGEPIAYLIGEWSFCGLPFYVSPEALIPRVDTEMLAQLAMNRLKENPGHTRILDLCAGTGCLGITAEHLSSSGTVPVEKLRHAVADHRYKELPEPICKAMEGLEQELITEENPLLIDVRLDRAMFEMIFEQLKGRRCAAAVAYFQARADMLNAITLLRVRRMGRDEAFFEGVRLPGGAIARGQVGRRLCGPRAPAGTAPPLWGAGDGRGACGGAEFCTPAWPGKGHG